MKAVIQRVKFAKVEVNQQVVGEISHGILVYLGLGHDDDLTVGQKMIDKILTYRIFEDENGKMGKNVADVGGGVLLVSVAVQILNLPCRLILPKICLQKSLITPKRNTTTLPQANLGRICKYQAVMMDRLILFLNCNFF